MRYIHREGCPSEGLTVVQDPSGRIVPAPGPSRPGGAVEIVEHRLDPEVARKQNKAIVQTTVRCIECNSHEVYPFALVDTMAGLYAELSIDDEPERRAKNRKEPIGA